MKEPICNRWTTRKTEGHHESQKQKTESDRTASFPTLSTLHFLPYLRACYKDTHKINVLNGRITVFCFLLVVRLFFLL